MPLESAVQLLDPKSFTQLTYSLVVIAVALVASWLLRLLIGVFLRRWHDRRLTRADAAALRLDLVRAPLHALVPAICVVISAPLWRLPPGVRDLVLRALTLWIIGTVSWLAVRIVTVVRDLATTRLHVEDKDNLHARRIYTEVRLVERVIKVAIVVLAMATMLLTFPQARQIGVSLLASAGIAGIILGFAAQRTLGNLLAGIQIAIAQPIRIDDVVIVEGEWGWIEEITLTYVVVRIWDLRRLVVPISYFIEKPFQNWTRTSAALLGTVFVYADYTIPVERVREELTRLLHQSPRWDGKVSGLQVTNTTERIVEMRALMSAVDSSAAWDLRCEIREGLLKFLQEQFPQCLPRTRVELGGSENRDLSPPRRR
jgi:small-conductance mechanosensitive channel